MHIKKLYIRDFGIYNNAEINNIAPGIVVFGGKNRSGKSTLLKLLRSFAYGIEKSSDVPPAKVEYEVEGEVLNQEKNCLNVRLKGYAKPVITDINDKNKYTFGNLYGSVDSFTYSKIFTISLDELQNLEKEEEKMQAVLLGAGLKDIIRIPKIINEYKKEAEKIGGKNGNPKTRSFKPFNNSISEGIEIKKRLQQESHIYEKNLEKLEKIKNDISDITENDIKIQEEKLKLELLSNNYDVYSEMKKLEYELEKQECTELYNKFKNEEVSLEYIIRLRDEYTNLVDEYSIQKLNLENNVDGSIQSLDKFKEYSTEIKSAQEASGIIREKIKNYNSLLEMCKTSKLSLTKELMDINQELTHDFKRVLEINTEEVVFGELCSDIDSLRQINSEEKEIEEVIKNLLHQKTEVEKGIKNSPWKNDSLKVYFIASIVFVVVGIFVYIYNKMFGMLVGVLGIAGSALYSFLKVSLLKEDKKYILSKETELQNINRTLALKDENIKNLKMQREKFEGKIQSYKNKLRLNSNVSIDSLKDYFRIVRDAKKKAVDLKNNLENLNKLEANLNEELNELYKLAIIFKEILKFDEIRVRRNFISESEYLFDTIKKLSLMLEWYQKFDNVKNSKEKLESKVFSIIACETDNILGSIQKTISDIKKYDEYKKQKNKYLSLEGQLIHSLKNERIRKLLDQQGNSRQASEDLEEANNKLLNKFCTTIEEYISLDEINRQIDALGKKLIDNTQLLEKLKETRLEISKQNQDIYDNDSLDYAQKKIDDGRRELKTLGEKYAVYNAAAFILKTLQKNFIEKTKDTLLVGAQEILKEITNGEYVSILPQDDLTKCDFITVEKEGSVKETTSILSRGTKEQLFLAVRLSRIKEIKEKLPIIIDDSLVNFDMYHLKNVIKVLKKISTENQIFILTCHPEVVSSVMKQDNNAKYYEIENGKFLKTTAESLIDGLSVKSNEEK